MFPKDAISQKLLAAMNAKDPYAGPQTNNWQPSVGTVVDRTKCFMRAVYDFTVLGGVASTIPLNDDQGNAAVLPQGAIVTNVVAHVITQPTSAGSATVALGSNISAATTDLMAATAKASLTVGFVAGVPVGTAATWVGPVTGQTGSQIQVTIGTAALTAGKIYYCVEFLISATT